MKLVFATNNKHKVNEVQQLLSNNIQLLSLEDINCLEDIAETENTIQSNAILKANYITQKYGFDCFADDTGLEVFALNGEPGVYSARYAGEYGNSEKNIQKLLNKLGDNHNRKSQFRTCIALNLKGKQFIFEGICKGEITTRKKGVNGFGYDSVFLPENHQQTFAEMDLEVKNKISHRGKAVQKLVNYLISNY